MACRLGPGPQRGSCRNASCQGTAEGVLLHEIPSQGLSPRPPPGDTHQPFNDLWRCNDPVPAFLCTHGCQVQLIVAQNRGQLTLVAPRGRARRDVGADMQAGRSVAVRHDGLPVGH